jgi:hypothetical protein
VIFWQTLVEQLDPGMTRSDVDEETGESRIIEGVAGRTFHVSGRPTGEAKPHIFVVCWERERDRWRDCCVAALKAGVDERRLRLEETETQALFQAQARACVAAGLTPEQVATFRSAFAAELRSGEAIEAVSENVDT